ncbi:MAG: sensor histidine kinase, partial [Planctomycetota bacterium]
FQLDVGGLLDLARREGGERVELVEVDETNRGKGALTAADGSRSILARLPAPLDHVAVAATLEPTDSSALLVPRALLYSSASLLFLLGTAGVLALGSLLTRRDELLRRRMDFVAAVSHELKAPLSGIRALAELMDTGIVRDETKQREYVSHILHESERLSRIVANVLDLAKLERKTRTYATRTVEPASVVQGVIASFREHMAREGVTLKPELPDRLPTVVCDPDALSQVISTLLDNACKYAGRLAAFEGAGAEDRVPEVRLVAQAAPGEVRIEVCDNGPGIPAAEREKVFVSFYRGKQHLEGAVGGAGLGLSIARRHMEAMGGSLSVIDSDQGACFRVVLRAADGEVA